MRKTANTDTHTQKEHAFHDATEELASLSESKAAYSAFLVSFMTTDLNPEGCPEDMTPQ